jgi:general stress protein 26
MKHKNFLCKALLRQNLPQSIKDGSPHVVPVWFLLDELKNRTTKKLEDIIFTTYEDSLKATNIRRDNRVSICVNDQTPQY